MTERERLEYLLSRDIPIRSSDNTLLYQMELDDNEAKSLAGFLLANGVILPPCKIGDEVWVVFNRKSSDQERWFMVQDGVQRLLYGAKGIFIETRDMGTYTENEIGKTVFLTREEAEAELEKRRKEGQNESSVSKKVVR